jgi:N-acyl-phosphatidylethanolamine-hydrolysing phospholipase D
MRFLLRSRQPARVAAAFVFFGAACGAIALAACAVHAAPDQGSAPANPEHTPLFAPAPRNGADFGNNDGPLPRASFLKWQWQRLTHGLPPKPANGYQFPVDHPDTGWIQANRSAPTMTWIGHATALLQIDGVNILTDPVFSERAMRC